MSVYLSQSIYGTTNKKSLYTSRVRVLGTLGLFAFLFAAMANASSFDGPAELPRVFIGSTMSQTPAPGKVWTVLAGQSLQNALDNANCGDTIQLQAGATFSGSFTLPAKSCDGQHWIVIRTSALAALPPEGVRVSPCYAGVASLPGRPAYPCSRTTSTLARILYTGTGASGPMGFAPGANHYRLIGLEITRATGQMVADLVFVRYGGTANNIVLDRSWVHGTTHDDTARGFDLNGMTYASVVDSYFSDFHCTGFCTDAQAVGGGYSKGPYKINHNFLESSGENILFGGGPATTTPADIEIRHNHLFKPLIWKPGMPGFVGGTSGKPFIVKNHLELKNAQRVLFEGNVLENVWGGFTQVGFSILLTPKNQTISGTNVCPLCQVTDVTIRYNTISHCAAGFQISTALSSTNGMALAGERFSIHDVTVDDINAAKYVGPGGFALVANQWSTNVLNNVVLNHVTAFTDPTSHMLSLGDMAPLPLMGPFTLINSIVVAGAYPVWSTGGGSANCAASNVPITSLKKCFTADTFTQNALIAVPSKYPPSQWPSGNDFPTSITAVQFVNANNGVGGDYHLRSTSPYKNAGTDGKDLGADIDAIQVAIAGAY